MLIDQYLVPCPDDGAALPPHCGLAFHYGLKHGGNHVVVGARFLELLAHIAPYRYEVPFSIGCVARVVEIHRDERAGHRYQRAEALGIREDVETHFASLTLTKLTMPNRANALRRRSDS